MRDSPARVRFPCVLSSAEATGGLQRGSAESRERVIEDREQKAALIRAASCLDQCQTLCAQIACRLSIAAADGYGPAPSRTWQTRWKPSAATQDTQSSQVTLCRSQGNEVSYREAAEALLAAPDSLGLHSHSQACSRQPSCRPASCAQAAAPNKHTPWTEACLSQRQPQTEEHRSHSRTSCAVCR